MSSPQPRVPLMDPARVYDAWGPGVESTVLEILRTHRYVKGVHVEGLEAEFASACGVDHAIAVDSGTDALWLVLRAALAAQPPERREVVLPTYTFVATASAVVNAGGKPVFVDVDPETCTLCPKSLAAHLGPATAAVVPVHLYGTPVDWAALEAVLDAHVAAGHERPFVLEDAAQAHLAEWKGQIAGALGDAGAFSFYPSKNLGAAGDGGMVTTNDEALALRVRGLREHGTTRKMYQHEMVGTNSRMDEIQAAVLRAKLPHLAAWTEARGAVAARYIAGLEDTPVRVQRVPEGARSAWHLFTVRVDDRDAVRAALTERGIATGVYYPRPLHLQACFGGQTDASCPGAEALAASVLSLPCFPGLRDDEIDQVLEALREVLACGPAGTPRSPN